MPERVLLLPGNTTCLIESWGDVTESDLKASLASVVELAQQHPLTGILVDANQQTKLPPIFTLFSFAEALATRAISLRHAVVIANQGAGDLDFVQTVSLNRGVNIQIFATRDEALAWLAR